MDHGMEWNGTVVVVAAVPRFAALPLCPLYEMKARPVRVGPTNGYVAIASNKANLATEVLYLFGGA